MGVVVGAVALVAALVALAATLAVYPAMFRAFTDGWRRIPPERRQRAWFGLGLMLVGFVVVAVLLILEPWGADTVVWVILVGGGATILVALTGAGAQAAIDIRRARRHRADRHRPDAT